MSTPSAKHTWSCRHPLPLHITWSLHLSSVYAPVDVHGRSHNLQLIYSREVLLAWQWVIARPLSSHGIILLSLLLGVGFTGVGLVHWSHAWQTPTHRECQSMCDEKKSVLVEDAWLSMLVCHFIGGDISHDLTHHLICLIFLPIFNHALSLKGINLH